MLKLMNRFKQAGFTLVELMIALVINSLLMSGLIAIFVANLNHYNRVINTNRLNQQLESTLQIMANDIRRAGYWANAYTDIGTHQNNNPFMASGIDVTVNGSNNCILFAYDHDSNGTLPSINASNDDERYGYRLNGQAVQARPPGAAYDCNATASSWENVTDTNIVTITALTFTLTQKNVTTGPGTKGITMRSVDITMTGQLKSDATITNTLTQHIRLRNDKFIP
jgi:prepilin peptidase dependent protein B